MHKRDLDKNMTGGRSSSDDVGSSRDRTGSEKGSSSGTSDRMRNSEEDIGSDMSDSSEDLQQQQSEGNLGNERVRGRSRSSRDDMRGTGE